MNRKRSRRRHGYAMFARQAIETRYHGPTNTRGGRIKATHEGGRASVTVHYDHGLDAAENHAVAARALMRKLGWKGKMIAGSTRKGYVFVFSDGDSIEES